MSSKRVQVSVLGFAVLGALGLVATGAPIVSSGPFTMPDSSKPTEPVWAATPRRRTAVRVKVTAGTTEVRTKADPMAADTTKFGVLSAGGDCVFEGDWVEVGLSLPKDASDQYTGFPASGMQEVRDVTAGTPTDRLLGQGSTTVTAASPEAQVYLADAAQPRLCAIRPLTGGGWIRPAAGSGVLTYADAGDWTFALLPAADRCFVVGAAAGEIEYAIHDAAQVGGTGGTFTFEAHGTPPDTDYVHLDGTSSVTLTLENAGANGPIWLYHDLPAGPQPPMMVPAGGTQSISGMLRNVRWVYQAACTARLTLQTN